MCSNINQSDRRVCISWCNDRTGSKTVKIITECKLSELENPSIPKSCIFWTYYFLMMSIKLKKFWKIFIETSRFYEREQQWDWGGGRVTGGCFFNSIGVWLWNSSAGSHNECHSTRLKSSFRKLWSTRSIQFKVIRDELSRRPHKQRRSRTYWEEMTLICSGKSEQWEHFWANIKTTSTKRRTVCGWTNALSSQYTT